MRIMLALAATLALSAPAGSHPVKSHIRAAVAATANRSADNVKLDAGRKPAELLEFLKLKPGMKVLDLFGANHYWAEIIAPTVGSKGSVTVWQPSQFYNDKRKADFAAFAIGKPNVSILSSPFEAPSLGAGGYDFAIMNLDYHDVYWENPKLNIVRMDPDAWLKTLYAAMKPGGVVGVVDHVAAPGGDTRAVVEALHRIDPAVIKADFTRAGFVLEAESGLLRNPGDDHSLNVFDEKIRGKTDRVAFRFRKPRA